MESTRTRVKVRKFTRVDYVGRAPRRFAAKIPAVEAQGIQLGFVKYPAWVHYVRTF